MKIQHLDSAPLSPAPPNRAPLNRAHLQPFPARILPALAGILFASAGVICLLPILWVLVGVFWHDGAFSAAAVSGAFADASRLVVLIGTTLAVTAGTVGLSLLLGAPMGFLCFRTDLPGRRAFVWLAALAACVPSYVTATSWMAWVGMHPWMYRAWAAAWFGGLSYAPLVALITGVCFAHADPELEDSTTLDAGSGRVFWHTILPHGSWGIAMAAAAVTVLSLWDITITDILVVRTFGEEIFTQFQIGGDYRQAAVLSFPAVLVLILVGAVAARALARRGETSLEGIQRPARILPLGPWRWPAFAFLVLAIGLLDGVPLAALVKAVGNVPNLLTAWRTAGEELLGTLWLTPAAATASVLLAVPAAWILGRKRRGRPVLLAAVLLLLAVPSPVVGIGLIEMLNRPGLPGLVYDTRAGLVLAYVIRSLPFAILALLPGVRRIPRELDDAMSLEGAGETSKILALFAPHNVRGIAAAWFLSFLIALSDVGASFLVVPPGRTTLTIRFFTLIHYGVYPDAAGICLLLLALIALCGAALALLARPFLARRGQP